MRLRYKDFPYRIQNMKKSLNSRILYRPMQPKSIFVRALSSDPLALNMDFILEDKQKIFQTGLNILKKFSIT